MQSTKSIFGAPKEYLIAIRNYHISHGGNGENDGMEKKSVASPAVDVLKAAGNAMIRTITGKS